MKSPIVGGDFSLGTLQAPFAAAVETWRAADGTARLWRRDKSLFSDADEDRWLGWLDIVERQLADVAHLRRAADDARTGGADDVVVLGMGGSSLCPEVLARTFGRAAGFPRLSVVDSTVPAQVARVAARLDSARTWFVVASKSGSTIEPNSFKQFFYDRTAQAVGADGVGSRFLAVTDPGTKMQQVAERDRFRAVYYGLPDIGGRFSALSNFGMIPAASAGIDVVGFLEVAREMVRACGPEADVASNPGVLLGLALGTAARAGCDKLTVFASPGIGSLGAWLEQLIAESTGKHGQGIVPIDGERLAEPAAYGDDRLFVYVRLASAPDAAQDAAVAALKSAGRPVITLDVPSPLHLGAEFFRWEIATAVAGSLLGINPFDQPDVESAKIVARSLMETYERTGVLPEERATATTAGIGLFADAANAAALRAVAGHDADVAALLRAHLGRIAAGDYFAINAYLDMNEANDAELQRMRHAVRDARRVATTVGYGPRFLHSTGQLHKGGPNSGVFLQITSDDAADLPIPGQKYSFGVLKSAQAGGDFAVLAERGRRIVRVHLGSDVAGGLRQLGSWIVAAS